MATLARQHGGPAPRSLDPPPARASAGRTPTAAAGNQAIQGLLRGGRLRAKLEVGGVDDPKEREADAIADRVMRMPDGDCCADCAGGVSCADETVRRRPETTSTPGSAMPRGLEHQVRRLTTGGEVLAPSLRAFFEPRLGQGLGQVRVHRDAEAHTAARSIQAKAFTLDQHIGFGAGQWSPDSPSGRRLLAHELAHVAGGHGAVRRQTPSAPASIPAPTPPFRPAPGQLGRETSRVTHPTGRIEATIARTISCGNVLDVDLVFDPDNECLLETGRAVEFVNPTKADRHLPAAEFEALAARFIDTAATYLDRWFAIRISGSSPGCTARCRDVTMPIRVRLRRQSGGYPITLATAGPEREHTQLLLGGTSRETLRHEAGHVALGISDEYREPGVACREGEHVEERDFSVMADVDVYGRRAMLHPRHFSHIVHWFETLYPGCRIELIELKTSRPLDFDLQLGMGTFGMAGTRGFAVHLGARAAIPLDRLRNWALTVGPHAHLLTGIGDSGSRDAYLLGLRFGLERRFTPSAGGPYLCGFAELGYGSFGLRDYRRGIDERERGAYGLVGGSIGWGSTASLLPSLAIEGALGTPIGAPGRISEPGGGLPPTARESFWQLGVTGALRF